ncbi:MAG TPA: TetR/AcrR family transcriptional regulator [Syntrophales bacterium]|nr:TetR/AcrR family transcriptional regulator [Syntrophales bacterium]
MFGRGFEEKKEYISKIAADVFFEKGFKASSLQDISAKGKISKAGIYHYFKSKGDILSYLLMRAAENLIDALTQCLRTGEENNLKPKELFGALCKAYAGCLLKDRKVSVLVLRDRHQLTKKERNKLIEKERAIFHLLRNKMRAIPKVNPKIDINLMSFQIISMSHWMGYWFDSKGSLSESDAIDQIVDIMFHGIMDKQK